MKTFIMFSRLLKSFQLFPMYAKSILLQRMAFPVAEFLVQEYKKLRFTESTLIKLIEIER